MKKVELKSIYSVGDHIQVQMIEPKDGKFPIGRTKDDRFVVCKIALGVKGYFEYNSTWECEVKEVHANKLVIIPLDCLISAAAESFRMKDKISELKDMVSVPKAKKQKVKKNYQYLSKNEQ